MYLSIQVENNDTPEQVRRLAHALNAFALDLDGVKETPVGATSDSTGASGGPADVSPTPAPKRTRKPAQTAAVTPTPEVEDLADDEPDDTPAEPEDDGEEQEAPAKGAKANGKHNGKAAGDDKALRQEVLERFASYADEAGVLEGKSLLGEFNATKFSEVAGTDLRAFAKRLTVLEASL